MADITSLIQYYANLLIVQYHNKPKAKAEMSLLAQTALADGVYFDVQNAYNIISNFLTWDGGEAWDSGGTWDQSVGVAVGKQLDVIGKYVGVDRFYSELTLDDYFSFITYDEVDSPPDSPPRFGFSDYTTFDDYEYNGTLVYDDIITHENSLFDSDFLTLIQLAIIQNNSNYSHASIDTEMYNFFGLDIRPESSGGMEMTYFVSANITPLVEAIIAKKLFPKPMGVGLHVVNDITGLMFAFSDYSGYSSPYGYGFSDYSNFDSLSGQDLIYAQIS